MTPHWSHAAPVWSHLVRLTAWRPSRTTVMWALAVIAALGLLEALRSVTSEAVRQGEMRRQTTALFWQATWRCNHIADTGQRQACFAQLRASPPEPTRVRDD